MTMIAALSLLALATNSAPVKPVSASAKLLADYRIALEHDDADALAAPGGQMVKPFCARFIATITSRNGLWRIATFSESALACGTAFP